MVMTTTKFFVAFISSFAFIPMIVFGQIESSQCVFGIDLKNRDSLGHCEVKLTQSGFRKCSALIFSFGDEMRLLHIGLENDKAKVTRVFDLGVEGNYFRHETGYECLLSDNIGNIAYACQLLNGDKKRWGFRLVDDMQANFIECPLIDKWGNVGTVCAGFSNNCSLAIIADNKYKPTRMKCIGLKDAGLVYGELPDPAKEAHLMTFSREKLLVFSKVPSENGRECSVSIYGTRINGKSIEFNLEKSVHLELDLKEDHYWKDLSINSDFSHLALSAVNKSNDHGIIKIWNLDSDRLKPVRTLRVGKTESFTEFPISWGGKQSLFYFFKRQIDDVERKVILCRFDITQNKVSELIGEDTNKHENVLISYRNLQLICLGEKAPIAAWRQTGTPRPIR